MKKIELEEARDRKKRFTLLTFIIIGITIILAIGQVILANRLASFSEKLAILAKTQDRIVYENELLRKKVASESAIAAISVRARQLSLDKASKFLVIEEAESVALLSGNNGF